MSIICIRRSSLVKSVNIECGDEDDKTDLDSRWPCEYYSALSSPRDRLKRFTLYFPDRPVHSDTISASLGSIQPYATINA